MIFGHRPLLVLALLSAVSASAQILVNGSFEAQTTGDFTVTSGTPNTTSITGWTVNSTTGSSQLNISSGSGLATNGVNFVQLNSNNSAPGVLTLSQSFATTPGFTYSASLDVGRVNSGGTVGAQVSVFDVASGSLLNTGSATTTSNGTLFFGSINFQFIATGANSNFVIADLSNVTNAVDTLIDNAVVSVVAVPEPSTWAALSLGLVAAIGFHRRRG